MTRPRLLWLSPFLPWPLRFGGTIRVYHLLRTAAARFDIDLAYLIDPAGTPTELPAEIAAAARHTHVFRRRSTYRSAQLRCLLAGGSHHRRYHESPELDAYLARHGGDYAAVVAEFTHMSWAPIPAGIKRVLDLHNIEAELLARTAESDPVRWRKWWRARDARELDREERDVCRRYDLIAAPSPRETDKMAAWGLRGRLEAIPNGVDTAGFAAPLTQAEAAMAADCPEIVFIGTMQYYPNEQAALHFATEIWPLIAARRPATTFGAIGGNPKASVAKLASERFRVLGAVPEIRPYFHRAKLLCVPLLSGGGTRLKILEAAGSGTPIVTTSLGCEGIALRHGEHALIADTPLAFADACLEVLADPEGARRRAEAARTLVRDHYDWNSIGGRFAACIDETLAAPPVGDRP